MITGPSNYPIKKHQKQMQRLDAHFKEYDNINGIMSQIKTIGTASEIIKSGDENAIEMLQEKIDTLTAKQNYMKKINAYYRKHKTCKGCEGVSDEQAEKIAEDIKAGYSWQPVPFPSYTLTNNNAKIKNTQQRLDMLTKAKEKPTEENENLSNQYFTVIENTDIMRLQLKFEGKPSAEVRTILKYNGYKWSPSNLVWQRQLTNNARCSVKVVISAISKLTA